MGARRSDVAETAVNVADDTYHRGPSALPAAYNNERDVIAQASAILNPTASFSPAWARVYTRQHPLQWLGICVRQEEVSNGGCNLARV